MSIKRLGYMVFELSTFRIFGSPSRRFQRALVHPHRLWSPLFFFGLLSIIAVVQDVTGQSAPRAGAGPLTCLDKSIGASAARTSEIVQAFVQWAYEAGKLVGPQVGGNGRLMAWPEQFESPSSYISRILELHPEEQFRIRDSLERAAALLPGSELYRRHQSGY